MRGRQHHSATRSMRLDEVIEAVYVELTTKDSLRRDRRQNGQVNVVAGRLLQRGKGCAVELGRFPLGVNALKIVANPQASPFKQRQRESGEGLGEGVEPFTGEVSSEPSEQVQNRGSGHIGMFAQRRNGRTDGLR